MAEAVQRPATDWRLATETVVTSPSQQALWRLAVEECDEAAAADEPWDSDDDDAASMVSETASGLCRQALSAHRTYEQARPEASTL
jgi:hypothetical protein